MVKGSIFELSNQNDMNKQFTPSTVKLVFDELNYLNPRCENGYPSQSDDMMQDITYRAAHQALVMNAESSLAYNILVGTKGRYSAKQLWVIAYELVKIDSYTSEIIAAHEREQRRAESDKNKQAAKLAANKEASADVLATIKAAGKKLGDYYKFLNSVKEFRKEYYSKKYSMTSAQAFIAI